MVQALQGIQARFLGMVEHYQKGAEASRYFKEISGAKKSLITAIMKRLLGLEMQRK